jgi:hypothetical protein
MKFSHPLLRAMVTVILAAPLGLQAQVQVFTHDFTADPNGAPPPSPLWNISSSVNNTYDVVSGTGLALTQTSSGKVNEEFAQFTSPAITLVTPGDYITFTPVFNSANVSGNTGGLVAGLYNTMGTPGNANLLYSATGTATSDDQGYFGIMGYNTSAGTSTKFYTRTVTTPSTTDSELGYYSDMTAGTFTQLSSSAASGNANLANSTAYTLTLTVAEGAAANTITAQILQGATVLDDWVTTDSASTYSSFDELVIGFYGKNAAINGNVESVTVSDYIQQVPEPATFALAGLGLSLFAWHRKHC